MRLAKLRKLMSGKGIDGLLLSSKINQSYITGADFDDGFVAVTADRCVACVDFRYYEAVKNSVFDGVETLLCKGSKIADAVEALLSSGAKSIAVEGGALSVSLYKKISAEVGKAAKISDGADELVLSMRAIKTGEEIEKITAAQRLTDLAFEHILSVMTSEMTECDVALELEFFMRKNGAEAMAFDVIAVSGGASALPHGVPRNVKLQKGFLTMDFGAKVEGYCSDMTRTVVIGKADAEMKKLYGTVLSAQNAALDMLRAGVSGGEADKAARDVIDSAGYEGCFGHSLGHGVGRYIHEEPRLSPKAKELLEVGNIVTVEPGIYIEGKYGCRIEDMVAITEKGIHNFTKSKKELIELF